MALQLKKIVIKLTIKLNLKKKLIKENLAFFNSKKKWKYWAFYSKKDLFTSVN